MPCRLQWGVHRTQCPNDALWPLIGALSTKVIRRRREPQTATVRPTYRMGPGSRPRVDLLSSSRVSSGAVVQPRSCPGRRSPPASDRCRKAPISRRDRRTTSKPPAHQRMDAVPGQRSQRTQAQAARDGGAARARAVRPGRATCRVRGELCAPPPGATELGQPCRPHLARGQAPRRTPTAQWTVGVRARLLRRVLAAPQLG
jgi:hypothetical protein